MRSDPEKGAALTGTDRSEGGERHVLVVDDNAAIRCILGRLLHLHRFTALDATSIAEAMASAEQHHVRAIILDLNLGEESGVELLARLRQHPRYAAVPIVILTAQAGLREDDEALITRHHAHVFYKPQRLSTIVEHLARHVAATDQSRRIPVSKMEIPM
jgi:CheY-like chemotaxis protein